MGNFVNRWNDWTRGRRTENPKMVDEETKINSTDHRDLATNVLWEKVVGAAAGELFTGYLADPSGAPLHSRVVGLEERKQCGPTKSIRFCSGSLYSSLPWIIIWSVRSSQGENGYENWNHRSHAPGLKILVGPLKMGKSIRVLKSLLYRIDWSPWRSLFSWKWHRKVMSAMRKCLGQWSCGSFDITPDLHSRTRGRL